MASELLSELLLNLVGRVVMFIRYPNKQKRKLMMARTYDDSYSLAGSDMIYAFLLILLGMGILFLLIMAVISSIIY